MDMKWFRLGRFTPRAIGVFDLEDKIARAGGRLVNRPELL